MHSTSYRLTELFILFVLIPVSFAVPYPIWIKMIIGLMGFFYVIYFLLKVHRNKFKMHNDLNWQQFLKHLGIQFLVIGMLTGLYLWVFDRPRLFYDIQNNPVKWLILSLIYIVLSVYPQELIYRTFFFQRYQTLFKSRGLFIFLNGVLFSLAHLFFRNGLVLVMTFIGGILFAITFNRTKSTLMVSIEHALYGVWLYTVGMGNLLGFPE